MTADSILLIDNDSSFVRAVSLTLEAGGYDVDSVSGLLAAEAHLADRDYGVIVLSLDDPGQDPEDFLRSLASDDRQPIVVLVSSELDIEKMVRLYDSGCVFSHRLKPLQDISDLIRDLGRAIEYRLLKRQNGYLLTQLRDTRDELHSLSEFLVQVEKAASLGWVTQGLLKDLEAALADAPALSYPEGSGRVMRTHSVSTLNSSLDRCRNLIGEARALVQGPRGEFRPIELSALVHSVARLHRTVLEDRSITLEIGPIDETVLVNGDGPNLRLVITALLQNAAEAMPSGGTVTVSLVRLGEKALLKIRDAGNGIPSEVLSRAFEPFYTTRRMGEGTGLGLSVAKEIVHQHGGEIVLASIVGEGTTSVVTLPVMSTALEVEPPVLSAAA